jgi:1-acyl-sn-glycerol-3-phosphate acyltransferase
VRADPRGGQLDHDVPGRDALAGRPSPGLQAGAFTLAKRSGVPILPIVIEGTANALPKRGFVLQGRHAIACACSTNPHATFAAEPDEAVTDAVHARFAAELEGGAVPRVTPTPAVAEKRHRDTHP